MRFSDYSNFQISKLWEQFLNFYLALELMEVLISIIIGNTFQYIYLHSNDNLHFCGTLQFVKHLMCFISDYSCKSKGILWEFPVTLRDNLNAWAQRLVRLILIPHHCFVELCGHRVDVPSALTFTKRTYNSQKRTSSNKYVHEILDQLPSLCSRALAVLNRDGITGPYIFLWR